MINFVKTADAAGHGIFSAANAILHNATLIIIPQAETAEEHENKSNQIYEILSEIEGLKLMKISFAEREVFEKECYNPVAELKAGTYHNWESLTSILPLKFKERESPYTYYGLMGKKNTLVVFQKLISDEAFGATASMQSLSADDLTNAIWNSSDQKVYGQHFHKVNDREAVVKFANERKVYVPGLTENEEVFGIRGRKHGDYTGVYENVQKAVAIPGTHTWIMLLFYPGIRQLIPYRSGIENWSEIAQAWRKAGYNIFTVEFNDSSSREAVRAQIAYGYKLL
jgi:hypothetical protein